VIVKKLLTKANEKPLPLSNRRRAEISAGADDRGEQFFVGGRRFAHVEVDELLSFGDPDVGRRSGELQRFIRPDALFLGVDDRGDRRARAV